MAKVNDRSGNPLEIGSLVHVKVPDTYAIGKVTAIDEGGRIAVGGSRKGEQAQVRPGTISVTVRYDLYFDSRIPDPCLGDILALVNREPEEKKVNLH